MAKKEFSYRGKSFPELKAMGIEDFAKLVPSNARRSLLRGANKLVHKKVAEAEKLGQKDKVIRTHARNAVVTPMLVGWKLGVHSGNQFQLVEIVQEMLGHRLGELALTRKKLKHGKAGIGATRSSTAITARG